MLPLPQFGKAEIGHLNALFQRNPVGSLDLPGGRYDVSFIATTPLINPRVLVRLRIEDADVLLYLSETFMTVYLEKFYAGEEFGKVPVELQSLIFEAVLAEPLTWLEEKLGVGASVSAISVDAQMATDEALLPFCLTEKQTLRQIFGLISRNEKVLPLIVALVEDLPATQHNWDSLPLPLYIEVGTSLLPLAELSQLAVGDVILLDGGEASSPDDVRLRLQTGRTFPAKLESGLVRVVGREREEDMSEEEGQDEGEAPLIEDVDGLPVRLVFEIGKTELTVGELRALAPGFTLDLGRDLNSPVIIKTNGRTIGSGDLVEVDRRLGVRITELFQTGNE